MAGGTRVVFPAPGSATRTRDRAAPRRCARISGMTGSIGSGVHIARPTMIAQTAGKQESPGIAIPEPSRTFAFGLARVLLRAPASHDEHHARAEQQRHRARFRDRDELD